MIGVYVHVPYCAVRCTYCDFYLVAGRRDPRPYVEALCGEIAAARPPLRGRDADTVHFGGGTPSLLPPAAVRRVLDALGSVFALAAGAEIALEANPEDLDEARCEALAEAGVTRIAIGVQSLDDDVLRRMRRPHDARGAISAVTAARLSPIPNVAVDLILGFPGQDPGRGLDGVRRLADLGVDHVSLYLLEVQPRTALGRDVTRGRQRAMTDDGAARLYEEAADHLEARGFEHYEISNFARPGHRSRHNLKYWTDQDYVGFGPSAHSYVAGRRWANPGDLRGYIASRGRTVRPVEDVSSRRARAAEALFAGLRLLDGVETGALRERYGDAFVPPEDAAVEALASAGFLERSGGRLRLTRRGRLVSNEIFERLLPQLT